MSPPGFFPCADTVFPQAQLEQSKALELQGVLAAENGDLSTALERFSQAICLLPERASAYNNRAQARRLQGDVAGEGRCLEMRWLWGRVVGQGTTKPLWSTCLYLKSLRYHIDRADLMGIL